MNQPRPPANAPGLTEGVEKGYHVHNPNPPPKPKPPAGVKPPQQNSPAQNNQPSQPGSC